MLHSDIRYLFDYDRWATKLVFDAAAGIDETTWAAPNAIGDRGLGGILVHALGAHQRWRHALSGGSEPFPAPEEEPLPAIDEVRSAWEDEWVLLDAWLARLEDASMNQSEGGVTLWQALAHVVNHGTQHRSEAAALLTAAGHSPGEIDMIFFAESLAAQTR
jgi:uncharacterized damage-inducible protein DinB